MEHLNPFGRSKARSVALLVAGILAGSVLIQPAVAHFRPRIGHLIRHVFNRADPRYINTGEAVANAANADKVDNLDAAQLVSAGVHTSRPIAITDPPVIDDSFNYVNGTTPTISGSAGTYDINMGFDVTDRFVLCSVDTNYVDTRDALCTVSTPGGNTVRVRIFDISAAAEVTAEFWVQVYGQ
jgi:hypothetical protein